jgi:citrate lyase subunit beta/citryl-CoA lyase
VSEVLAMMNAFDAYPVDSPARQMVRRSSLIMPVNVPAFVEKAHRRGADAIVLDLEDSIPPAEKDRARTLVKDAIPKAARGGADVTVRINRPWELGKDDLDATIWPGLAGISFPKPETVEELQRADEEIGRLERERGIEPGHVKISISIESVAGFFNARALAHATPRLVAIGQGSEDFTLDLEIEPTPGGLELLYGKLFTVLLAREAGLYPMGTMRGVADFRDLDGYREAVRTARSVGYRGSSCIHPSQVPILNEGFSPVAEQVAHARRVIEVYEEAEAQGRASVALDGKMIDIPVVVRAQRLIARAERIAAFEERKRAALAAAGEAT